MVGINKLREKMSVIHEGEVFEIVNVDHFKLARAKAFVKIKLKNWKTHKTSLLTFPPNKKFEIAFIQSLKASFLYADHNYYYFFNQEDFKQILVLKPNFSNLELLLSENQEVEILSFKNEVLKIILPEKINLKVKSSTSAIKGDSVNKATKYVTLETNLKILVPLFVKKDDVIIINSKTLKYISRYKNNDK